MNFWDQAEIPRFQITSHVVTYVEETGLCRTPRSNEDQRPYPSYKQLCGYHGSLSKIPSDYNIIGVYSICIAVNCH